MQTHVFTTHSKAEVSIFDWRGPTLHIFNPFEGHAQNETLLEVKGVCTDLESGIGSVEVRVDGSPWVPASVHNMTWSVALQVGEGVHEIEARAMDNAANMVNASVSNVTIDLTPPEIDIWMPEYPGALRNTMSTMIVGTTEPGARVLIGWKDEADNTNGTFTARVDLTMEGRNDYWVIVIDRVGNVNRTKVSFTIPCPSSPTRSCTGSPGGSTTSIRERRPSAECPSRTGPSTSPWTSEKGST